MSDITLSGSIDSIIYQNDVNGYTIFVIMASSDIEVEKITCVGVAATLNVGEDVKCTGEYVTHPTYGRQFKADFIEKVLPTTLIGMEKYLASGVISGIGEKRAAAIVNQFGEKTFEIMELDPVQLSCIRGISISRALAIGEAFASEAGNRNIMMYLQKMGLTINQAQKIIKKYGAAAIDTVKKNPYVLAEDIFGIGFRIADGIAQRGGLPLNSPHRLMSGLKFVLNQALQNGHVFLPKDILLKESEVLLDIPQNEIESYIIQMHMERNLWQEKIDDEICIYLHHYYFAESHVARKLMELNAMVMERFEPNDDDIAQIEHEAGITLADLQREAVRKALNHGVLVITGGPGTGKTTTLNTIIKLLSEKGLNIRLAAPTGRAAKRMSEATGRSAGTIHRLLGINSPDGNGRIRFVPYEVGDEDEDDIKEQADVIIVDESSMVDIMLMYKLLAAISHGIRLILVGDMNQLPSVGPGNVLKDIIQSGKIETICLDEVFRQSQQSAIVMNAHRINSGEHPLLNERESDFFFMSRQSADEAVAAILDLITNRLPKFFDTHALPGLQVLTPTRKTPIGTQSLNVALQSALNPPCHGKPEKNMGNHCYRVGDKVMQIKNNYGVTWRVEDAQGHVVNEGAGIFNGDEGEILEVNSDSNTMLIRFDEDRLVDYEYSQLDELMLAYAITIHKSQGSEYDVVIIPIMHGPPMLMTRNLLYTAVTRAKKLAVIVGVKSALFRMVDNDREEARYSTLKYRLEKMGRVLDET